MGYSTSQHADGLEFLFLYQLFLLALPFGDIGEYDQGTMQRHLGVDDHAPNRPILAGDLDITGLDRRAVSVVVGNVGIP